MLPERSLQVTPVPGTHLSMMVPPNAAVLGEALSRGLERARAGGTARPGGTLAGGGRSSPVVKLRGGKAGVAPLFCVPGAGHQRRRASWT